MPDTTKHTPHENDILIVTNIDTDCDIIDTEDNYPHSEYFQVKWSGHPHRIAPGATKRMPRFLAEHFAKHLANHMLLKMEESTGRKGLMQSSFERPKMIDRIILGVDSYFLGDNVSEADALASKVDELNPGERPMDLGTVPSPLMGVLKDEPKKVEIKEETVPSTPDLPPAGSGEPPKKADTPKDEPKTSIVDPSKPKPSRKELFADCEKLGIEVTGRETVDQLIAKIKAF